MVRVRLSGLSDTHLEQAVREFNARYGEMERVLWCLSQHCRRPLLAQEESPVVAALVWTIKSWWGVQGVRSETKELMGRAVASFDWPEGVFAPPAELVPDGAEDAAVAIVAELVKRTQALGVTRREYSLASKVLHWLLPWRVPVYDGFVRQSLGVPGARDHPPAYRQIVREEFAAVRAVTERNPAWVGSLEPRSPLRAFDKCLWWFGGGNVAAAAEVRRPWQVVDELGLDRC